MPLYTTCRYRRAERRTGRQSKPGHRKADGDLHRTDANRVAAYRSGTDARHGASCHYCGAGLMTQRRRSPAKPDGLGSAVSNLTDEEGIYRTAGICLLDGVVTPPRARGSGLLRAKFALNNQHSPARARVRRHPFYHFVIKRKRHRVFTRWRFFLCARLAAVAFSFRGRGYEPASFSTASEC